jgi:hypothetical protein
VNSGGIYTTPIKTSSSNLNNVDDTFTQTDKMKLIILKFHIFYTYFTVKKILEVNKKQNKNLKLDREALKTKQKQLKLQ